LEQFEDSDDEESYLDSKLGARTISEHSSSEVSSVVSGSEKASVDRIEAQECAFCRSEVSSFLNELVSILNARFARMQYSNVGLVFLPMNSAWQ